MTRKCRTCKEVKNLTEFTRRPKAPQGREYQCKACRSKARYKNGAYLRERFRKHQYRHSNTVLYTDVTINAVLTADKCCYCGDELTREKEHAKQATLDHVYLGHNIDDNVVVCCRGCNTSKDNYTSMTITNGQLVSQTSCGTNSLNNSQVDY